MLVQSSTDRCGSDFVLTKNARVKIDWVMKWSAVVYLLLVTIQCLMTSATSLDSLIRHEWHRLRLSNTSTLKLKSEAAVAAAAAAAGDRLLRAAVIAPSDPNHQFSLKKILPAITLAARTIEQLNHRGPLPGWKIQIVNRDSKCSSVYGPLEAFDLYNNKAIGDNIGF